MGPGVDVYRAYASPSLRAIDSKIWGLSRSTPTVQLRKECQRDDHQRSLTGNGEIPPRREQEHVTAEQDR